MTTTARRLTAVQLLLAVLTGLTLTVAGTTTISHAAQPGTAKPHVEALFCSRC